MFSDFDKFILNNLKIVIFITLIGKILPVKIYPNFYYDRQKIRKDHKGKPKSGIYLFINLTNWLKMYVGQSKNILGRMNNYLNNSNLKNKNKNNQPFINALLKYGQKNFCLIIIEYIPIHMLNNREILWIKILKPYYNISLGGHTGMIGYKHSKKTLSKLQEIAKNRKLSDKTKSLISISTRGVKNPFYGLTHSKNSLELMSISKSIGKVFIYNDMKILLIIFTSATLLSRSIKASYPTIINIIKTGNLFRGEWYLTRTPFLTSDKPKFSDKNSKEYSELIEDIIKNKHILKAIFVFNAEDHKLLKRYNGVIECAKDLNISHNNINKYLDTGKEFKSYLFSTHKYINLL